jgi:hypothetical protein
VKVIAPIDMIAQAGTGMPPWRLKICAPLIAPDATDGASATFCEQKVAKKRCYSGPVRFQRLKPKVEEFFAPLLIEQAATFSPTRRSR